MSNELISEINLSFLMNKEQFAKYMNETVIDGSNNIIKNGNTSNREHRYQKDKRFYKKRIYDLTKQLMNNEPPVRIYPDVKTVFDNYVKTCVEYFKALDTADIIQEDYASIVNTVQNINSQTTDINTDGIDTTDAANKLMLRTIKITEPNSLEKIVTRTSTRIKKPQILPVQKDINLKDPMLKNKGICKKNNIINNYDDSKK